MSHTKPDVDQVVERLRSMGKKPRRYRDGWLALCPAHQDTNPSLSISSNGNGRGAAPALLYCFAGCDYKDILQALGLNGAAGRGGRSDGSGDMVDSDRVPGSTGIQNMSRTPIRGPKSIVATYDYRDERGRLLYQVVRFKPKDFRCRRRPRPGEQSRDGWIWNMKKMRRLLYRLPEVLEAIQLGRTVYIVEGEKDADRLVKAGLCATTNLHGAPHWRDVDSRSLQGAHVCIIHDNDEVGERHAKQVMQSLRPWVESFKILRLPNLPPKGDVSGWLDSGRTIEELKTLVQETASLPGCVNGTRQNIEAMFSSNPKSKIENPNLGDTIAPEAATRGPLNDLFHAREIARRFGHSIRFCEELGGFFVWDGCRWSRDRTRQAWRWAVETAEAIRRESEDIDDRDRHAAFYEWSCRAVKAASIKAALEQLKTLKKIAASPDDFDKNPHLLNCANGTVDLRDMSLREHRPEDMMTKLIDIPFDKDAWSPAWRTFLERIMGGNEDLLAFIQRMVGYALTGHTSEQKLFFLYGSGANGKSTFLNTLLHVWGEYGRKMPADLLFEDRRDSHPTAFAMLQGVRLAVTAEVEQGKRMAEVLVKELSGGDRLTARKMRQDYFEFDPTHKVFLAGNHLPTIRGCDQGIWRRISLVPFQVQIPEDEQDKALGEKLKEEAAGILNWCIGGAFEWHQFGLAEPAEVKTATGSYRSDMDILGDFLAECTKPEPGAQTTSAVLSKAYTHWCEKNGERAMSARSLGMRLKERGIEQQHVGPKRTRTWMHLALIEDDHALL